MPTLRTSEDLWGDHRLTSADAPHHYQHNDSALSSGGTIEARPALRWLIASGGKAYPSSPAHWKCRRTVEETIRFATCGRQRRTFWRLTEEGPIQPDLGRLF